MFFKHFTKYFQFYTDEYVLKGRPITMGLLSNLKILVVDDEAHIREILESEFQAEGAKVYTAENGTQGFEAAKNNPVDIIISDIRMPGGSGIELLDKIKAENVYSPVVLFMTGFSDLQLDDAYAKGAEAVFSKPFQIDQIIEKVRELTPPFKERYTNKPSPDQTQVIKKVYSDLSEALKSGELQLGRGGIFIRDPKAEEAFKAGSCSIQIEFQTGSILRLNFDGTVQWRRSEERDNKTPGLGVEFHRIDPALQAQIEKMINVANPVAFIPNGSKNKLKN